MCCSYLRLSQTDVWHTQSTQHKHQHLWPSTSNDGMKIIFNTLYVHWTHGRTWGVLSNGTSCNHYTCTIQRHWHIDHRCDTLAETQIHTRIHIHAYFYIWALDTHLKKINNYVVHLSVRWHLKWLKLLSLFVSHISLYPYLYSKYIIKRREWHVWSIFILLQYS